jgi:ribonuclease Z
MACQRMRLAGIDVEGVSVGGLETFLHLPGMRCAFDIGRAPAESISCPTILFTHAHVDHLGGVVGHCATRALRNMPPPTYVVPASEAESFNRLFEVWRTLDRSDLPHTVVPLEAGERHELGGGLVAEAFAVTHRGPSLGYAILEQRRKLKPEFRGLAEEELRRLRVEEGVEITRVVESVEVAYSGDCLVETVEEVELVRRARLLILEATFVDDRVTIAQSREKGHIHLDELVELAGKPGKPGKPGLLENEAILLVHFSSRYRAPEIVAALEARLPEELRRRVTPLLTSLRR